MPDRIATARQSGEESSLREKAIEAFCAADGRTRYIDSKTQEAIEAVVAVCMEEAANDDAIVERMARWLAERELLSPDFDDGDGGGPNWCLFVDDARHAIRSLIPTSEAE